MISRLHVAWRSDTAMIMLIAFFLSLNVFDAMLTNVLLANSGFIEANPLLGSIAGTPLIYLKGLIGLSLAVLVCRFTRASYRNVLLLLTVGLLGICAWNTLQMGMI